MGAARTARAQADPVKAAEEEALRRQETTIVLRQNLARAQDLEKRGDLKPAASLYEECTKLVKKLGSVGVDAEHRMAMAGLNSVRLNLAQQAFRRADFKEADTQMKLLLDYDPTSQQGLAFRKYSNDVAAAHKGRMPSPETLALIPQFQAKKVEVATMVQDAKLLYEMRLFEQAEEKLKQAIKEDPANQVAYYYMNLIHEARYGDEARRRDNMQKTRLVEVEKAWQIPVKRELLPSPNPYVRTNVPNTSSKVRQALLAKMEKIVIPELFFDGLPLTEVVKFLSDECKKADPQKKGLNFIINPFLDDTPTTRNVAPAGGLFGDPMAGGAGAPGAPPLLDAFGAPIAAAPAAAPAQKIDLENVIIKISPPIRELALIYALDAITKAADQKIKFIVEDYAIVFTPKSQDPPQLFIRTYKVDPNTFVQGLEGVTSFSLDTIGGSSGGGQGGGGGGRGGGGGGRGGGGGGQGGGQGGQGEGGVTIPRVDVAGGGFGGQGGGQGGGGGGGQGGGGQGGQGGGGALSFVTRTNNTAAISTMVRDYFQAAGVNLGTNATGGAATQVFFNDRTGVLMVRAALQDLEIIEHAIEILNIAPQQITIESKFAEVTQQDNKGLGFNWSIGNFLINNGNFIASAGTQPSFTGAPSAANPAGTFPGVPGVGTGTGTAANQLNTGTLTVPSSSDGFLTSGLRNQIGIGSQQGSMPTLATLTGILTDPQFRMVINALEQRAGVDVLSAPRVTTLSGRQAQVQVVDMPTIVTGLNLTQTAAGGQGQGGGFGNTSSGVASAANFDTQSLPFGPVLDVLPYVSADGFSIQMTLIPTFTEFLGYDDPGPFIPQAQSVGGSTVGVPLTAVLPLPRMRTRQVVTSAIVWDGQTIMLGGLISEDVRNVKDKVPVLGDLPLLGRLFRSESKSTSKKNLIIFVTPTLVDPAGNRVHTDEELPFAKDSVPGQPWLNRDRNHRSGW